MSLPDWCYHDYSSPLLLSIFLFWINICLSDWMGGCKLSFPFMSAEMHWSPWPPGLLSNWNIEGVCDSDGREVPLLLRPLRAFPLHWTSMIGCLLRFHYQLQIPNRLCFSYTWRYFSSRLSPADWSTCFRLHYRPDQWYFHSQEKPTKVQQNPPEKKTKNNIKSLANNWWNNGGQNDCSAKENKKRGWKRREDTEKTREKTKQREQEAN